MLKLLSGLGDAIKIGLSAMAGATLVGGLIWAWFTLWEIPRTARTAFDAGEAHCQAEVTKAHAAERARQQAANQAALDEARLREQALANQNDTLNDQLQELAHAIMADDSSARMCLDARRVRDLDAIR